jgi:hypothetical protein
MTRGAGYGRSAAGTIRGWGVTRQTFENLEDFMRDIEGSKVKAVGGMDLIIRTMVFVTKGLAQEKSMGPVAPRHRSVPALAYRIPVQRISGRYFAGWTQRRLGPSRWLLYNDSVEAYLIEEGIYQKTRRPILKLSLLGMLRFIQTTRTAERFLDHVIAPRRNAKGQFASFQSRAFGGATMHTMSGPTGRLPG